VSGQSQNQKERSWSWCRIIAHAADCYTRRHRHVGGWRRGFVGYVDLQAAAKHLRLNIEAVIDRMRVLDTTVSPAQAATVQMVVWRQPGLFVPLLVDRGDHHTF